MAALLVLSAVATAPATGAGPLVSIAASRTVVTYGGPVAVSGTLQAGDGCRAGRTVELQWAGDPAAWEPRGQAITGTDGSYGFTDAPAAIGSYRVAVPAVGTCGASVSSEVRVRVRTRVDASLLASTLTAGSCVSVSASITPPKPGQRVQLLRRTTSGWRVLQTLELGPDSTAGTEACFGFEDLGIVRMRIRWPTQDPSNAPGRSSVLALRLAKAPWMRRIDRLVGGRSVSVAVGMDGTTLYRRAGTTPRTPASNEKLLLSMALLDRLGPAFRITTAAAAAGVRGSVIPGDLWVLGRGDPEIRAARMGALARRLVDAGIQRIRGRVMGAVSYFRHDWWAPGWRATEARRYVAPPTALTFALNRTPFGYTHVPELQAARSLTTRLRALGIRVRGRPGMGPPPPRLGQVAAIRSRPLRQLLARMDRPSDNFYAEVLGKLLGARSAGPPGTIAKGALALRTWVSEHGEDFRINDGSGLSHDNRVTAAGIVRLLELADAAPWGRVLRQVLPTGGQGTLEDRLQGERIRAKTGTLDGVSALSGWVWLDRVGGWAAFSILSSLSKPTAVRIEDGIVRSLAERAR